MGFSSAQIWVFFHSDMGLFQPWCPALQKTVPVILFRNGLLKRKIPSNELS